MTETSPLLTSKIIFEKSSNNPLVKLQDYLRDKSCPLMYNLRPLIDAKIIEIEDTSASIVHLCTLIENRWTTEEIAPYHGDELCPGESVGDIWRDYSFIPPNETRLTDENDRYIRRDLPSSQRKEPCTNCDCQGWISCDECEGCGYLKCLQCHEQGQIECCRNIKCQKCSGQRSYICQQCLGRGQYDCLSCHGQGQCSCPQCVGYRFVRIWICLHIRWYNHSICVNYQPEGRCQIPRTIVENSSERLTCFVYDAVCSSMMKVLKKCRAISDELREMIMEKYGEKPGRIIRLRCVVQRLKINEYRYKIDGLIILSNISLIFSSSSRRNLRILFVR